jgi:hypothetical protein
MTNDGNGTQFQPDLISVTLICFGSVTFNVARITREAPWLNLSRAAVSMSYNICLVMKWLLLLALTYRVADVDIEFVSIDSEVDVVLR